MAPDSRHSQDLGGFRVLSRLEHRQNPTYRPPLAASDSAFPVLAIVVLSIMGTAFLLVSYYVFVSKCWSSNWYHLNLLSRRMSLFRARRDEDTFLAFSPTMWNRGLDESVIREIPTFQFKRRGSDDERGFYGCVVCLNEFQKHDMVRVLPKCSHAFHLDCIDIWLQSNGNCPLCRTSISGDTRYPVNQIIAPSSSPQGSQPNSTDSLIGGDDDFVVIELGEERRDTLLPNRQHERDDSRESSMRFQPRGQSPRKTGNLKPRKRHHNSIMGDECIDVRQKDDNFSIQPIRRSFSLDSAVDRQLYQSVQAIVKQHRHTGEINKTEECSNRGRTSLFPVEHGRKP